MRLFLLALVGLGLLLAPALEPLSTNAAAECVVVNVEDGRVWVDPDCPQPEARSWPG